jgi:hypothetical protein
MRKILFLGGGVVVLLLAALTACSDGLAPGDDDPLADRWIYVVHGITYLEYSDNYYIPHVAFVGLRSVLTSPFGSYIRWKYSNKDTGYYELGLDDLDEGYYITDACYDTATKRWEGSGDAFYWDPNDKYSVECDIYMDLVE